MKNLLLAVFLISGMLVSSAAYADLAGCMRKCPTLPPACAPKDKGCKNARAQASKCLHACRSQFPMKPGKK